MIDKTGSKVKKLTMSKIDDFALYSGDGNFVDLTEGMLVNFYP